VGRKYLKTMSKKLLITESEKNNILLMYGVNNNLLKESKGSRIAKQFAEWITGKSQNGIPFSTKSLSKMVDSHKIFYKIEGSGDNIRYTQTEDIVDFTNYLETFLKNASDQQLFQFFLLNDPEFAISFLYKSIRDISQNANKESLKDLQDIIVGLSDNEVFMLPKYEQLFTKLKELNNIIESDSYKNKNSVTNKINLLNEVVPVKPESLKGELLNFISGRQLRRLIRILKSRKKDLSTLKTEFNQLVNNPRQTNKQRHVEKIIDTLDAIETTLNSEAKVLYESLMDNPDFPQDMKNILQSMTVSERKIALWDEVTSSNAGQEVLGGIGDELNTWKENIKFWKMFSKKPPFIDGDYFKQVLKAYIRYGFNAHMVSIKNLNDAMVKSSSRTVGALRTAIRTLLSYIISPALIGLLNSLIEIGQYVHNELSPDWLKSILGDDYYSEYESSPLPGPIYMINEILEELNNRFGAEGWASITNLSPILRGPFTDFSYRLSNKTLGEDFVDEVDIPINTDDIITEPPTVRAYSNTEESFRNFVIDNLMEEDKIKRLGKSDEFYYVVNKDNDAKQWYTFSNNTFIRE